MEAAPKAYQQNSATSPVTLIAVGSQQQSYKGHDVLIAAVAELRARGRDVRLTLVGDGRVHDDLELQAERLGLDDVKFLRQVGTSDDVIAEVRRHDIFVMPSRTEGMPKALLEAMLAGVFSLGSNVGGFQKCWIPSVSSNPTRRPRWSKGWNTFWSARF
nr:glycosyltransferase family 4 protein [Microbacterium suwonense]